MNVPTSALGFTFSLIGQIHKKSSANLPFLSISGGNRDTSLAVATTNTGAFFSCIPAQKRTEHTS
jgi:hypothetical protein